MSDNAGQEAASRSRSWAVRRICPVLGASVSLIGLAIAGQLSLRLGLAIYVEQALAAILGISIALACLSKPISKRRGTQRVPWYDMALALVALVAGCYLAVRYPVLSKEFFYRPVETLMVGAVLLPLTIEGLRRVTGKTLVLLVLVFVGYALLADLVPGKMQGRAFSLGELMPLLAIDNVAVFGLPLNIAGSVVIVFIFFGQLLLRTGGSEWFTDLATSLVGRTRGGSAKIAVVASGLFGSISGSAVSNVASTGVITIPMMTKAGFSARSAAAFEAVASTGGQFMPPVMGAAAFLMAEFLELPYTTIIVAAALPAVIFYIAVLIQADLMAARLGIAAVPKELIRRFRDVLREGWYFPIPFALLVAALFYWNKGPAEAALWSIGSIVALSLIFGHRGKRIGLTDITTALIAAGRISTDIVLVGAAAGIIIGVLESTGLGFGLTFVLIAFGEGSLFGLLVLTAIVCIILGMGMPTTGIYILVATLAGPPLIKLGVDPLAAHLFVLYFGLMSMISPPVAIAAFTAASMAKSGPIETALTAMRFGWIAFVVPFIFVYSPALLLKGSLVDTAVAAISAVLGVWLVSAGIVGYLRDSLNPASRLIAGAAGALLLIPGETLDYGWVFKLAGVALALTIALSQRIGGPVKRAP